MIRAPREFTLKENTIQIKQGGQPLSFTMEEAKTLTDGSLLFIVKPEGSSGLGYYSESRDLAGDYLDISYQMELNFLASGSTFAYRELLFITDKNYGTNMTSSYAEYLINDSWGIAEAAAGSATFHKPDTTTYRLPTTKVNSQFSTAASKLNFGLDTTISKDDLDPINDNMGILDKESRIFETTFSMKNLYQNGYVDKQGKFIAYIPIAKQDLLPEWTKDESDYPHQFSLALTGPVKLTSIKGVSYEVGYTTDDSYLFNNGRGDFLTADGYATYKKYDEINADLAKVTMVKIVAKATDSSNVIVPFGEEMSATLPLKFQSGSAKSFYENTGQKTSWQPYLVQNYTMNGVTNEFHNAAPKRSTRIRYRPERQKIDLFAYNEEDHPNSNDSKTGQVKLPGFINQYNLDLQPLNPSSFYSLNLNSLDQIRENKKSSVSYGNSTFAFTTDLNRITTFDLIQAYEGKALSLGGLTGNDDFLNYQVYNADNINDTLGERQVTLKYRSTNSDDIEFEVVLNVIRKASKIQAENALIAGKVYKEFTNAEDNIRTTLQDGSFTTQFEMNTQALQDFQVAEGDKENYYLLLSEGIKLPQNATILMKLQSKDGTQKSLSPEYYFYRNKSATAQSKISLFDFQKMGTNDTMLTADDVKRHVDESESLSYLFVFDFEQGALASVSDKERVQMSYPLTTGGEEDTQATPEVKVNASRMTSHNIFGLNKKKYEPGEVLTLSGGFNAMSVGKAVDSFNQYKYFVLDLQLVEVIDGEEKPCNWPAGSSAQNTVVESNPILYPRMGVDSSHLVVPVSRVDPNDHDPSSGGTSIPIITPYSLDIRTDVSKFGQGKNYRIKINSVKNLSTYYPLGGEKINSMLLGSTDFKVVKPEASGLNVKTEMKDRVIYNQSATQTVNFDLVMDNIEKIVPTIEIQRGTIFEERPWQEFTDDPQPVINTEDLTAKKWSLTFKENLPATLNDEYHIIFKAYRKGESQPAYEVPWSFVVWDPIKK